MGWFGSSDSGKRAKRARHGARRRAREAEGGKLSARERAAVYDAHNGICCICRCPVPRESSTIEHKTALANGGDGRLSNLGPAHRGCNSKKGARTDEERAKRRGLRRRTPLRRKPRELPEDVF